MVRPWRGWGIGAFWMTERTMYGGSEELTWVNTANHSHNAYLDTALIGGFPFPICTPAHGTAYEIAGKGIANLGATRAALALAIKMAGEGRAARKAA